MSLLVDTSVWSRALRTDADPCPEVFHLARSLRARETVLTTGLVLQELLQGFHGPSAEGAIVRRFAALPFVPPERDDHIAAARLRNHCRRQGVQVGTIDALLAQLCIRHEAVLLTADRDFDGIAQHTALAIWSP